MVVRTEKSYSDSEIMNILRNGDADEKETIKKHLYLVHRGIALSQISKKGINPRKFEDLYADSMVMLYRRIESGLFRGETKISSYFFDIFRYAIIGSFKKTGNIPDGFSIVEVPEEFENAFLKNNILEKLTPLLEETFDKLKGTNCKKALSAELQEVERHKISGILGFKHPKSLDNALSKCRKKLRKFIESNPTLEYQIKALYYELIR